MNIDDIFADANYRGEESLYPLSKVKSQHDKEKLSEQGYVPGYTVEEWEKEYPLLPVKFIFYQAGVNFGTVYYDRENLIFINLRLYDREMVVPFTANKEEYQKYILSAVKNALSRLKNKKYVGLFLAMPDGLRMDAMNRLLEIEGPTSTFYEVFLTEYTSSNFLASRVSSQIIEALPQCKTEEMNRETQERLSQLKTCGPEEIRVYRGESNKSTPPEKAISWTPNINVAYFFSIMRGNAPSVLTGRIKKSDVIEYINEKCETGAEEEILVIPGTVILEKKEILYDIDSKEIKEILPEAMEWYHPFRDILTELYEDSEIPKDILNDHNVLHSLRVLFLSSIMGVHEKLDYDDMDALCFAAVYHDAGRCDDTANTSHGKESEKIYESKERRNKIASTLIRAHCIDDDKAKTLIQKRFRMQDRKRVWNLLCILKDADALDRLRFGMKISRENKGSGLDVSFLRTSFAAKIIPLAKQCIKYLDIKM